MFNTTQYTTFGLALMCFMVIGCGQKSDPPSNKTDTAKSEKPVTPAAPVAPATGSFTAAQIIANMDKNGDGKISKAEASKEVKPYFENIDTNGDGVIDLKEAQVMAEYANKGQAGATEPDPKNGIYTAEQIIAFMDKNGDGKISNDEASKEVKPHFENIDTNGDGVIDLKEAQVMAAFSGQQSNSTQSAEPAAPGPVTAKQLIRSMDKNGDRKISKDEASEDLKLFFGQHDTNKDGVIDATEAQALVKPANQEPAAAGAITAKQVVDFMDKNGDGKISMAEASDEVKPHFENIDTNGDGVIDVKEAQVMAAYATAEQIVGLTDKNGDGKISKAEASDELKPHFQDIDTNGDGVIDVKEAQVMTNHSNENGGK
jgi:Ca2+-binding EF-hand superfamily protein